MLAVKYLVLLIVIGVAILFSTINMASVPVSYYNLAFEECTFQAPLVLVVVVSGTVGFLIAWFLEMAGTIKSRFRLGMQGREVRKTSTELERLKVQSAVPKSLQRQNVL